MCKKSAIPGMLGARIECCSQPSSDANLLRPKEAHHLDAVLCEVCAHASFLSFRYRSWSACFSDRSRSDICRGVTDAGKTGVFHEKAT